MMTKQNLPFRLFSELLIIFAGVYGAFWVEGHQQDREDRERALTILVALQAELTVLAEHGPVVRDAIRSALDEYDLAEEAGRTAVPAFYREPQAETPSTSVWRATVASGGVNLLDPEFFFSLAAFYNRVESFSERYLRYNVFTEREVLPLLSQGAEAFYDPQTGTLDPNFAVHMDQLRTLWEESSAIVIRADALSIEVGTEVERLR
jgi:hypothetical protein